MMAWRSLCSFLECGGNDYAHLLCSKMHFPSFKHSWCMCVCVIRGIAIDNWAGTF
jgi:hypothetical protein